MYRPVGVPRVINSTKIIEDSQTVGNKNCTLLTTWPWLIIWVTFILILQLEVFNPWFKGWRLYLAWNSHHAIFRIFTNTHTHPSPWWFIQRHLQEQTQAVHNFNKAITEVVMSRLQHSFTITVLMCSFIWPSSVFFITTYISHHIYYYYYDTYISMCSKCTS